MTESGPTQTPPGSDTGPGDSPDRETIIYRGARRPWLPLAIACAIAFVILLILLIPGILRYPAESSIISDRARAATNDALERRIETLRSLMEDGLCVADGNYALPGESEGDPLRAVPRDDIWALPPVLPGRVTPQPDALPEDSAFTGGSLLELIDSATVIVLRQSETSLGSGTGFFVSPRHILTNRHVTDSARAGQLVVSSRALGAPVPARLLAETPPGAPGGPDFALLEVDITAPAYLSLTQQSDRLTHVIAGGFPSMVMLTDQRFRDFLEGRGQLPEAAVTEGTVTARQPGQRDVEILLHTAQVTEGNSGGPLLDRCGRVVGVNTFIRTGDSGRMNYALAAVSALDFLARNGVTARRVDTPCIPDGADDMAEGMAEEPENAPSEDPAADDGA